MKKILPLFVTLVLGLAFPLASLADDISNNLDASVDALAEQMPLTLGGANGTTQLYVVPRNGDGKQGCNLTTNTDYLTVSVQSSDATVATVSPSSVTFHHCGDTPTLTVSPLKTGSAVITLSQVNTNTGATFNLAPATFQVNVAPPPNTAPTISVVGVTGGTSYETGAVPAATCSVVDAEDGNSSFPAILSAISGPLAAYGLGEKTASCSYTDQGGLTASASVTYSIVDTTKPVITLFSRTPAANSNGWNNTGVTLVWTCADSGSGVVDTTVSQTVSAEGTNQSATGTCTDHAGNTASDTQSGINIDETPPTITASRTPDANGYGWNKTDVTVSFNCADTGSVQSGIGVNTLTDITLTEGYNQSATSTGACIDKAGNSASAATISNINIDETPPTTTFANRTPAPNAYGWNNTSVTVNWTCFDGLSGTIAPTDSQTLSSELANQSATGTCQDLAGNTSSNTQTGINIDETKPTLSPIVSPNPVVLNGTATTTPGAADGLSGVATQSCGAVDTSTVGTHSVLCTATDKAGNSNSQSANYKVIYRFDGFLQPINDTAHQTGLVTSIFKGGSTVPAKFQLKDANGNIVQAGSTPAWLTPVKLGPTSAAIDESVYSDSATSGSSYRWDATSQQYIYNWSTKGSTVGFYYKIGVTLDDGTTQIVNLGLK